MLVTERRSNIFHNVPQRVSQLPETSPQTGMGLRTITWEGVPALGLVIPPRQWFTTAAAHWGHPGSFKKSDAHTPPPEIPI